MENLYYEYELDGFIIEDKDGNPIDPKGDSSTEFLLAVDKAKAYLRTRIDLVEKDFKNGIHDQVLLGELKAMVGYELAVSAYEIGVRELEAEIKEKGSQSQSLVQRFSHQAEEFWT